jgi:NADH-quinone oxidoreductase subunit N
MYETLLPDLAATGPILLVAAAGLAVVLLDSFRNDAPSIPWISGATMAAAMAWELLRIDTTAVAFAGHVYTGGAVSFANAVILLGSVGSVVLVVPYLRRTGHAFGEVYALILFATSGLMTFASSGSLVTLFVGLETMSVCLYVLTGLVREETRANEAALKYFLLGAFSTGFFLYGIALVYGASGTMLLSGIAAAVPDVGREGMLLAGVALLLVGFLFKVGAVPFHMWTPDVYQGAPTPLTGYMATTSKAAAFAALIVVLAALMPIASIGWEVRTMLALVSAATMIVGNVVAVAQRNVKRMLAYSSIAHAGYLLAGLATGTSEGYAGALYYLLAYTLMNLGAFGVMALLEWDDEQGAEQTIDSLAGVGYRRPLVGVTMGVFMFALAGFPPLAGFIGKYMVFGAAIRGGLVWLAVIGVLTSAISAYYYLRVLVALWMREPGEAPERVQQETFAIPTASATVLVACAVALLLFGVLPAPALEAAAAGFEPITEQPVAAQAP